MPCMLQKVEKEDTSNRNDERIVAFEGMPLVQKTELVF